MPVDVGRLRAPNAAFAAFWQLCCRWWSPVSAEGGWPNPVGVGPSGVSMGLWGRTQAYQRSHRQLLIGDDGAGGLAGLIFSRPLNAEAALHSATALRMAGAALEPLLESEFVIAQLSGWSGGGAIQERSQRLIERQRHMTGSAGAGVARARVVSEAAITEALVARIDAAGKYDSLAIVAEPISSQPLRPGRRTSGPGRAAATVNAILAWGSNDTGDLGTGSNTDSDLPVSTHLPPQFAPSVIGSGWGAGTSIAIVYELPA